jgi:penicillin-binding protein 2
MFNTDPFNQPKDLFLNAPLGRAMPPEEQERTRKTLAGLAAMVLVLFGVLFLRLWSLQLVQGEQLKLRSESNRLRVQDLPPWRGMILDRRGEILVANRPSFDLVVILEDVPDSVLLARRLNTLLKLDPAQTQAQLEAARQANLHLVRLKGDLTWQELGLVETYKAELPGTSIFIQPKREYRYQDLACHVLGYLGEITEAQLKSGRFPHHKMGDYIGRCGIEAAWEEYLRGQRGFRRIEVDAYGRELGQLDQQISTPGANVHLTLDLKLQQEAEACLADKQGAIVALEPKTGKIRAMASTPGFSQETFERGLSAADWQRLSQDKSHPLENRAIKGQYPPGSTFKIVMALAALEEKVITPGSVIYCSGAMPFGNHVFHCWKKGGHGGMNLHSALVNSCDIYFYQVGRKLGIDRIAKWSRRFGLGAPTGLKLDKEMPGLVASSHWKQARFGVPWQEGDTVSVAIGQGYNLATPLQMALVAAAAANGGLVLEPQLLEKVESPAGEILFQAQPVVKSRLEAKPAHLALVQRALTDVVAHGTGKAAKLPHLAVAGKTGTSQVVSLEKEKRGGKVVHKYQNHAWFVATAPAEDARLAVAVIVEHGGGGGAVAAPLAKRILAAYFPDHKVAQAE